MTQRKKTSTNNRQAGRRRFLRLTGAAGALALLDPSWVWAAPAEGKVLVRRDIMSLAPNGPEIAAFRRGVAEMKKLADDKRTSWIFQANVHLAPDEKPLPEWNQCQHGNYFFLPWHRMYEYWFERILRKASGDPNFTIPYWNYANPAARALPLALRTLDWPGNDTVNPLYVAERNPEAGGLNNGAKLPASAVLTSWNAFRLTQFATHSATAACFGGRIKARPGHALSTMSAFESYHNLLHVLLGGRGGYMSDLALSARDPLFLLHHANVDRLWKRWLEQGGGRANPTNDPDWMNATFTFFDEDGKEVKMPVKDALDTEKLGYRYDDDTPAVLHPQPGPLPEAKPETFPIPRVAESKGDKVSLGTDGPVPVTMDLGEKAKKALADGKATLTLFVEGIQFVPAGEEPKVYYEVYLNLPKEKEKAPDFQDVHYAGNLIFAGLGLFGLQHHHHHPGDEKKEQDATYLDGLRAFDVTEVLRGLAARGLLLQDKLTVTFVLGGLVPLKKGLSVTSPGVKARFDRVALACS
jgi:tyrosinase